MFILLNIGTMLLLSQYLLEIVTTALNINPHLKIVPNKYTVSYFWTNVCLKKEITKPILSLFKIKVYICGSFFKEVQTHQFEADHMGKLGE